MELDQLSAIDPVYEPAFTHHEEEIDAGRMVMELGGELDMFVSPRLAARFRELAEDGCHDVVVDLSDVRFIDTYALGTLLTAQQELQAHDHALAVVADRPYPRRTFEVTGLEEALRVSRSRDEALGRLRVRALSANRSSPS
jgi:anti-sigma B factor antagonist